MKSTNGHASRNHSADVAERIPGRARVVLSGTKQRSAITNGTTILPGVDGRSAWVRRCRDLIALHVSDMGGEDRLSEAQRALCRRAAVLTIELEQMELRFSEGNASSKLLQIYQQATNTLRRTLQAIGLQRVPRDVTPTLEGYLASKSRRHDADAEEAD